MGSQLNWRLRWSKAVWMVKQLLPLTYRTQYGVIRADGTEEPHFCVWKMWMGRCFAIDDVKVAR